MPGEHLLLHFIGPLTRWLRSMGPRGARRFLVVLGIGWIIGGTGLLQGPPRGDSLPDWHKRDEVLRPETLLEMGVRSTRGAALLLNGIIVLVYSLRKHPTANLKHAARVSLIVAGSTAIVGPFLKEIAKLWSLQPGRFTEPFFLFSLLPNVFGALIMVALVAFFLRLVRLHGETSADAPRDARLSVYYDHLHLIGDKPIIIRAKVTLLPTTAGGKKQRITKGYRPNHNFGDATNKWFFIGELELREGEWMSSGETRELDIQFLNVIGLREHLNVGTEWRIQEGGHLVGYAVAIRISQDPAKDGSV